MSDGSVPLSELVEMPAPTPNVFGPRQDMDGTSFYSYYDAVQDLAFIWDGKTAVVQICRGGYGEPVTDEFDIPSFNSSSRGGPSGWPSWFVKRCKEYIASNYDSFE